MKFLRDYDIQKVSFNTMIEPSTISDFLDYDWDKLISGIIKLDGEVLINNRLNHYHIVSIARCKRLFLFFAHLSLRCKRVMAVNRSDRSLLGVLHAKICCPWSPTSCFDRARSGPLCAALP